MPDEQIFHALVEQWHEETGVLSSTTEMVMSPAYQTIMAMGDKAVPFILRQLEREGEQPDNWFWALRHITRNNPVRPEHRGNRRAMAQAWFDWLNTGMPGSWRPFDLPNLTDAICEITIQLIQITTASHLLLVTLSDGGGHPPMTIGRMVPHAKSTLRLSFKHFRRSAIFLARTVRLD